MRYPVFSGMAASLAVLVMASVSSCSSSNSNGGGDPALDSIVSSFEIRQSVKSATRSFQVKDAEQTYFLTQSASAQWPEQFGNYDLKALQDTIIGLMYGQDVKSDITTATAEFVSHPSNEVVGKSTVTPIDSVPPLSTTTWSVDVSAKLMEYNLETVTYDIVTSSYLGGAHPQTFYRPFTYAFKSGKILNAKNMFKSGSDEQLLKMINQSLADENEVLPSHLESAGFFGPVTNIGMPFIEGNVIKIRYNPYEIGPYAMGVIDVTLYPGQIEELLTPEVVKIFGLDN